MATATTATAAGTATVLGVFAHVDTTVEAIERLKAQGYRDMTVYSPVPVHEIEDAVERDRPVSKVRLFTLIGGLTGTATGFFLTIWSALKWGLITGGKPVVSIPPFVVIAFELTILLGGLSILSGQWPRVGALVIAVFLAGVTPTMHNFWAEAEPARAQQMAYFTRNLALLGAAFLAMAIPEPWNAQPPPKPSATDEL